MNMTLLMKLGSLVVHAQEYEPGRLDSEFDLGAMKNLAHDPEVEEWLKGIDPALLPVKR